MSQFWTVLLGAVLIGAITVAVGSGYVSASSSKLPEQSEMIQLFVSGSIVGAFISWIISSGFLHGSTLMGMIGSDVNNTLKEVGLKGGDEAAAVAVAAPTAGVAQMVGGFFKSLGVSDALQELNVGMPGF
jgi:hypothetical protein